MITNQKNDEAFEKSEEKKLEANIMFATHYEHLLFIVTDIKLPHHNTMLPHTKSVVSFHTQSTYNFIHYSMENNADDGDGDGDEDETRCHI